MFLHEMHQLSAMAKSGPFLCQDKTTATNHYTLGTFTTETVNEKMRASRGGSRLLDTADCKSG